MVERARGDLRAAEICATELPATALFHCQQAAEKYLKAYLTWHQTAFRKTHELQELAAACALIDPALQSALDPAMALSKYAWQFRYPGAPYHVLKDGLRLFVERELKATYKNRWLDTAQPSFPNWQQPGKDGEA